MLVRSQRKGRQSATISASDHQAFPLIAHLLICHVFGQKLKAGLETEDTSSRYVQGLAQARRWRTNLIPVLPDPYPLRSENHG